MATPVTPAPAPPITLQELMSQGVNLKWNLVVSGQLPGESIVTEAIKAYETDRATMSQANRDGFDALRLRQATQAQAFTEWLLAQMGIQIAPLK